MAPVDDPKVTILITVDEPSNGAYYAGQVSVPYAKMLFTDIFNYMEGNFSAETANSIVKDVVIPEVRGMTIENAKKILKDLKLEAELVGEGDVVKTIKPYPGYTVKEGSKISLYGNLDGGSITSVVMPDLQGYSTEASANLLKALGLKYTVSGTGLVSTQSVPAGEVITKETSIKLELNTDYKD